MTRVETSVNMAGKAALYNVSFCVGTLEKAMARPRHLPGITVFYGPSGYGKSSAAAVAVTRTGAYYVQAQSSWTRKALYLAILKVMGVAPAKTMYDMAEQIAVQLANTMNLVPGGKPLIIDEADHLVARGIIETVRDIYEASLVPVMLIGEENLPGSLKKWERFHGRVLEFAPAQPASIADAQALRDMYATKISIADDLLALVHDKARGSVRRICVNLERIQAYALESGLKEMDLGTWANRELYTGEAPARRLSA